MKPPARTIVGNLIWGRDGGVWAIWQVAPFAHAHTGHAEKLGVHSRLRGLILGLPAHAMLLSVCEPIDPGNVVTDMLDGVDVRRNEAWVEACFATGDWLAAVSLYKRRYYVAAELPATQRSVLQLLRSAAGDVHGAFGIGSGSGAARRDRGQAASGERDRVQAVDQRAALAGDLGRGVLALRASASACQR